MAKGAVAVVPNPVAKPAAKPVAKPAAKPAAGPPLPVHKDCYVYQCLRRCDGRRNYCKECNKWIAPLTTEVNKGTTMEKNLLSSLKMSARELRRAIDFLTADANARGVCKVEACRDFDIARFMEGY